MLPAQMPDGGQYDVARAALTAALLDLLEHLGGPRYEQLRGDVLALHRPGRRP